MSVCQKLKSHWTNTSTCSCNLYVWLAKLLTGLTNNDSDHQHRKNMSSWAGDNIQLGFSEPWLLLKHRGEERKTANYTKWLISDTWNMRLCCDWSGSFVTSSRHRDFRRHQRQSQRGWEMTHWTLGHQLSTENSANSETWWENEWILSRFFWLIKS